SPGHAHWGLYGNDCMSRTPEKITLTQWDTCPKQAGMPAYCGPLSRHVCDGDTRLNALLFDNSQAAFRLWNFLLTEEARLRESRAGGHTLVGTMKDLGTVPVMAYSLKHVTAFYPDGAWWIPCVMELGAGLLKIADELGVDESFCPVRAMLGAFVTEAHFPIPDLLTCSVGAVCDDFSAIAQRLQALGHDILWWDMPHRRMPDPDEHGVTLPGGFVAPVSQVQQVKSELQRVRKALETHTGQRLDDDALQVGIARANEVRSLLGQLRGDVFGASVCPLPALEMLIAEMLAIHFCSDLDETRAVLTDLLAVVHDRIDSDLGYGSEDTPRVFWVNPVADLRVMNLLEQCGARVCGTEYLFSHALDLIPHDLPPMEALARMALADPMVGSSQDRADRICRDITRFRAQAVIISRIPGASHCALEGQIIGEAVKTRLGLPVLEIEIPPLTDAMAPSIRTRIEALVEVLQTSKTES
ncbi:MAG: 2-hydroxyacyl-CoA dehydratase family protein, partial [Phycisphaerae bacterium]|nr:2-hydroxyacyl-CoA dehydratase family protein [Phycisphaerae bacterium]